MAFTSGTATDHHDLLTKLKDYLDDCGWTIDAYSIGASLTAPSSLVVTGPGQVGGQQVHVSILTEADSGTNAYAWRISGHPDYDPDLPFGLQLNNSPVPYFRLWPNTMSYWFYVNDRRVIVVAKIGTYYMSMYAGFFLPYALPAEYPFPYYIGATAQNLGPYNTPDAGVRSFCDPGQGAAYYLSRNGLNWQSVYCSFNSANNVDSYGGLGANGATIWPYKQLQGEDDTNAVGEIAWSWFRLMRPLANGRMPLWQCNILDGANEAMAGTLDGVFATGGFNRAPEQSVTVDTDVYRLFINVNRNTPKHYFAVEEK